MKFDTNKLNVANIPKINLVKTDSFITNYDMVNDTIQLNINRSLLEKYDVDISYSALLALMESSLNPKRSLRAFNSAMMYNQSVDSRGQSFEFYGEVVNRNIATLILLGYMRMWSPKRRKLVYTAIKESCIQCKKTTGYFPIVNTMGILRLCLQYIHDDKLKKNKKKLMRVFKIINSKLQRDFEGYWLTEL